MFYWKCYARRIYYEHKDLKIASPGMILRHLPFKEEKMKLQSRYKRSACQKRIEISVALKKIPINSLSRPYTVIKADPSFPAIKSIKMPIRGLKITGNSIGCRMVCLTDK